MLIFPTSLYSNIINNSSVTATFLLHFNGANGSSTFIDDAGHSFLRYTHISQANSVLDTSIKKFGTASLRVTAKSYIYHSATSDAEVGAGNFTLETWVYPTSSATSRLIAGNGSDPSFESYSLLLNSSGNVTFSLSSDGNTLTQISGPVLTLNTWSHIAGVRSGNNIYLFVNGILVSSGVFNGSCYNMGPFRIGSGDNINNFIGYIDELRLIKTDMYTSNFSPSTTAFTL